MLTNDNCNDKRKENPIKEKKFPSNIVFLYYLMKLSLIFSWDIFLVTRNLMIFVFIPLRSMDI